MNAKHFFALAALAACLSAPPAFAYPHAGQKQVVSAGGASWTVLQDHQNPLRWYYVPTVARMMENRNRAGKAQPELALLKYQAPSPTDKSRLEENAFLFFTLGLTPEKATLDQLAAAIANMKPMQDAKATVKDILLEEIALQDIKLKLPEIRAEAAPDEGFGLPIPATALQFTLHLPGVGPDLIQKLQSQGLKVQLDFNYVAATPKPDGQQPALISIGGQIAGSIGLGAYPREVQDMSIIILPPGDFSYAFLRLPPVSASADIKQINYLVTLFEPGGKQVAGMQQEMSSWKTADGGSWKDRKGNRISFLLFPLKPLVEQAAKAGKKLEDYKFGIITEIASAKHTEKFSREAGLFTHGAPIALPPPPAVSLRVSPEFLVPAAIDTLCEDNAAAQIKLACGRNKYQMMFKFVQNEISPGTPVTFFFDGACGSIKPEGNLVCRGGKRYALTTRTVGNTSATMYLGY